MNQETKKQKRGKLFKTVLVSLGVIVLCCGISTCAAIMSMPHVEIQSSPTWAPLPTLTTTPKPTKMPPTPTDVQGNIPSSSDRQWSQGTKICLNEKPIAPAMLALSAAASSEPFDIAEFCTQVNTFKIAVVAAQDCWGSVCPPDHPLLQESHTLHDQALRIYDLGADLLLDFCETGEIECMNLALMAITDGNLLIDQSTCALERYNQKER